MRAPAWLPLIAAVLAVIVAAVVPALRASTPLTAPAQWTIADLAGEALHAATSRASSASSASSSGSAAPQGTNLRHWLEQARTLWSDVHGPAAAGSPAAERRLGAALAAAALIPVLAVVAGLCALGSVVFVLWRRRRWLLGTAIIGTAASVYVIVASWWLTHLARAEVAQALAAAQQRWGGLLAALGGKSLSTALTTPLGLEPQAGVYVLLLAFLAILLLPEGGQETAG